MSDQAQVAPVQPGDVLAGKYKVDQVLGIGGMGVVVAATHVQLKERVALKFLLPHVTQNEAAVARFLREAQAAVKIKSSHVARVIDVGTLETGSPYMVMEYLEGADLSRVLEERGPLPWQEACVYVLQACEALAEAHAGGIIHRDLKPANMFLTKAPDGSPCVKLLDFGISKVVEGDQALTRTQSTVGSPVYMSPEQMRSARKADVRSDIWSLGVSLYELLCGETPFIAETMVELCAVILESQAPLLRTMLPNAPEALEALIAKSLQKNPEDRYPSVAVLAYDLAALVGTADAQARAERIGRILLQPGESTALGTGRYEALAVKPPVPPSQPTQPRETVSTSPAVTLGQTASAPAAIVEPPKPNRTASYALIAIGGVAIVGAAALVVAKGTSDPVVNAGGAPAQTATEAPAKVPEPKPIETASAKPAPAETASAATSASASATASATATAVAGAKKVTAPKPVATTKPTATKPAGPADDPFGLRK